MRVYRIEDHSGTGPYHSGSPLAEILIERHEISDHYRPSGRADFPVSFLDQHHFFGFASMGDLNMWFGEDLDLLMDMAMRLSIYEVSPDFVHYGHSDTQLIFKKSEAKFIESRPIFGSPLDKCA